MGDIFPSDLWLLEGGHIQVSNPVWLGRNADKHKQTKRDLKGKPQRKPQNCFLST